MPKHLGKIVGVLLMGLRSRSEARCSNIIVDRYKWLLLFQHVKGLKVYIGLNGLTEEKST